MEDKAYKEEEHYMGEEQQTREKLMEEHYTIHEEHVGDRSFTRRRVIGGRIITIMRIYGQSLEIKRRWRI
jgi:hypothetical protein